jgi:hypothetical protein
MPPDEPELAAPCRDAAKAQGLTDPPRPQPLRRCRALQMDHFAARFVL